MLDYVCGCNTRSRIVVCLNAWNQYSVFHQSNLTRFLNKGHPLLGPLSSDRLRYKLSNFEQIYCNGTCCYLLLYCNI